MRSRVAVARLSKFAIATAREPRVRFLRAASTMAAEQSMPATVEKPTSCSALIVVPVAHPTSSTRKSARRAPPKLQG